jgi:hypothetical protein
VVRILAISLTILASVAGCKKPGTTQNAGVQFPVRVSGEGDAQALTKTGTLQTGDGQRLMFDLQREPSAASIQLWACWDMPDPTTPLGKAVCTDDAAKSFEVTARFVDLICRTSPDFGVVRATADIDPGCASYEIYSYAFEPSGALQVIGNK